MASGPADSSRRRLLFGLALCAAGLAGLVYAVRKPRLPPVTPERFEAARRRWADSAIDDYDLEVAVRGRQAAVYQVQVRRGEVQAALRDGRPLKGYRTLGTWSVPGMFETMSYDVEHQRRWDAGTAAADTPQVELRAEFDEQTGVPRRVERIQTGGPGANPEVYWEVRKFDRTDRATDATGPSLDSPPPDSPKRSAP